jgi:hypothetical protein
MHHVRGKDTKHSYINLNPTKLLDFCFTFLFKKEVFRFIGSFYFFIKDPNELTFYGSHL